MSQFVNDRVSMKLNTKAAVDKIRFGSPELKQVLRQRCREKLREKRGELFNSKRLGFLNNDNEIYQEKLHDIVRKEIIDITTSTTTATMDIDNPNNVIIPLTLEESIELEREIIAEQEKWLWIEEQEKIEESKLLYYGEQSMEIQVICPICEKGLIKPTPSGLSCRVCQLKLPPTMTLEQLSYSLEHHIFLHSKKCPERASFEAIISESNTVELYLACEDCFSFAIIR
ncbi:hypothetical protein HCN44_003819 [Aphidius gifuensis]|uniref:RPA-interacting protein C-terminal domain-containing protein n=1 Tax=Aphidius gifuensis TaxID=684658 RepID=A0A834XXE5_APHGI|nr:uncharacterized protein LOC122848126 [Aphidius gifuensis]KAF7994347.1 hypothetical protein HCN44_003819 [Aphidius gifuensis]